MMERSWNIFLAFLLLATAIFPARLEREKSEQKRRAFKDHVRIHFSFRNKTANQFVEKMERGREKESRKKLYQAA